MLGDLTAGSRVRRGAAWAAVALALGLGIPIILPDGPEAVGGCYDGQADDLGIVSLNSTELETRWAPREFVYRWWPPAAYTASAAKLPRVAAVHQWRAQRGQKRFAPTWITTTHAEFPVFDLASAFHRQVSAFLSENARTFVAQNTEESTWRDWLGAFHTGDFDHYESLSLYLHCREENLVSVELVEGCFPTRGGSYSIYVHNFVNENGRPRRLSLPDLFVPGSGWEKKLSDFCLRVFRAGNQDSASLVWDGTITSFSPHDLELFTVSRKELQIHFRCFQVTMNGGGTSEVGIPWSELHAYLRPDGAVASLIRR